jgi:glutathione-regulated potassium-efflux system ancillary protein KefC
MEQAFTIAALWLLLALLSAIVASALRLSIALVEICVGVAVAAVLGSFGQIDLLSTNSDWLRFLASIGAILLTFLAGAELDLLVMRTKLAEVNVVGLIGFFAPFLGCAALAYYVLGWNGDASWLAGIALSTTSMAVVYAVMLETGLNKTEYGKGILGACFINDLGTVIALGLLFSPFTYRTVIFLVVSGGLLSALPTATA